MKKIFLALDIDNTTIFQNKETGNISSNFIPIAKNDFGKISYCTKKTYEMLKLIKKSKNIELIFVTARTELKYKQTKLYTELEFVNYISNVGQNIFYNDNEDVEWSSFVLSLQKKAINYFSDIEIITKSIFGNDFKIEKYFENFYSIKFNSINEFDYFNFKEISDKNHVDATLSLNKINLLLKNINKGSSLKFMLEKYFYMYKDNIIIASGDGYLDLPMLKIANIAYIPRGSKINNIKLDNSQLTKFAGVYSTEEILEKILRNYTL